MPEKLARQVSILQNDPACEAVLGRVENFLSPELDEEQRSTLAPSANQGGNVHVGALLIRRAAFLRVGWFDVRWRQCDFMDWWARAVQRNLAYTVLPDLVMRRRLHTTNMTRREPDGRREYLPMLHEHVRKLRGESVKHHAN